MPVLQTLQHKVSRSRLRKLSSVSLRGDAKEQAVTAERPPLPDRTDGDATESLSPALATSPPTNNAMDGLMFWRKRDPSPGGVERKNSKGRSNPKPILRRRASSSRTDEAATPPSVHFGSRSQGSCGGYQPPPSAFSLSPQQHAQQLQQLRSHSQSPPLLSSPNPGYLDQRASSLPSSPASAQANPFVFPVTPSVPGRAPSESPASSHSRASPRYPNHAPVPTASPVTPPSVAPAQPSAPVAPSRSLNRRSSRPTSTGAASTSSTVRSAPTTQTTYRPSSVMSNNSFARGRRSSRPPAPSTSRTRASIASISTFSGTPGPVSPASPVSSNAHALAFGSGHTGSSQPSNGHGYTNSFGVAVPSDHLQPITPPSRNQTLTPPDEDLPMFNVIPATPQKSADAEEHEPSSRSQSPCRTLESMAEEEEEEFDIPARRLDFDNHFDRSPRLDDALQLGGSPIKLEMRQLDDVDSADESDDEPRVHARVEPAVTPAVLEHTTEDIFEDAEVLERSQAPVPTIQPPPRLPKSPRRQQASLYQGHDDGKSISHSLAELAALACDLPPLGEDMTLAANAAAQRLAHARAVADATPERAMQRPVSVMPTTHVRRPSPPVRSSSVPAVIAEEPEVAELEEKPIAPISAPATASITCPATPPSRPLPALPREAPVCSPPRFPLPPSPPFASYSYGSLPSLMSHDSMPSSASTSMPSSDSHASLTSSPDADEKIDDMLRMLSMSDAGNILSAGQALSAAALTPKVGARDLPDGLGLGLDLKYSALSSPLQVGPSAPSSPVLRPNRMSVVPAHHRAALYGTPRLSITAPSVASRDSFMSACSERTIQTAGTHTPHGSISSISTSDYDFDGDDVLCSRAQVVPVSPYAHAYVVGSADARSHEVGVAF